MELIEVEPLQLANKETKRKNTIYNIYRSTQINQK